MEEEEEEEEEYADAASQFSNTDEIMAWTGYGLIGAGVVALIPAYTNYSAASDIDGYNSQISEYIAAEIADNGGVETDLARALAHKKSINETAKDEHNTQTMMWGGLALLLAGGGVTLLSIDF